MDKERLRILELVAKGAITADEGLHLLNVLTESSKRDTQTNDIVVTPPVSTTSPPQPTAKPGWASYWQPILMSGVAVVLVGLVSTVQIFQGQIGWGWLLLIWPTLALGILVTLFGWLMRFSPWLRVHIQGQNTNIHFSLPIPLHWLVWVIWFIRPFIPQLRETITDDILVDLTTSMTQEGFAVEVQETSGEHVEVVYG